MRVLISGAGPARTLLLSVPEIMKVSSQLPKNGKLSISDTNLVYLDIDDKYIHHLFPLLQNDDIKKPDYFGEKSVGAHITVVYPEEGKVIRKEDLGIKHDFFINDLAAAEIGLKIYYVILVKSPSLLKLRKKYGLPDLLCFKGCSIGFHITIGVKSGTMTNIS